MVQAQLREIFYDGYGDNSSPDTESEPEARNDLHAYRDPRGGSYPPSRELQNEPHEATMDAICDMIKGEVLSPAVRRRTDSFNWSSSTSDLPQELVESTPASQEGFIRSLGVVRKGIKRDKEVPDEVYGGESTEETSPSQLTTTIDHDVPAGLMSPFHLGWKKDRIWTPLTGWINVGGSSSELNKGAPPDTCSGGGGYAEYRCRWKGGRKWE